VAPKSDFYSNTVEATRKEGLAQKLYNATYRQHSGREAITPELGDINSFRDQLAEVRTHAVRNLDRCLAALADNLMARGVQVHWAKDAEEARQIVLHVARVNRVSSIVKSKSMATEEIELNPALQADGLEVTETDLGEYIIQLAGQRPGHIVAPACHLSTQDIADIFREKIGYDGPVEPTALTMAARAVLREKFRRAEMGVSGVNFAVADPGLLAVCTNEGNARYATSRRIHLAVMGMERIVADLAGGALVMKMLAKYSTGQRITQYTNLIAGPCPSDGAQQVHLVILDNGRSRILASRYWRILTCIRCGACVNACPVFRHVGGQSYPGCYSGPVGTILLSQFLGLRKTADLAKACSLCNYCAEACPTKMPLPEYILSLRDEAAREGLARTGEATAMSVWADVLRRPRIYRLGQKMMRWVLRPLSRNGWLSWMPGPPGNWTRVKDLPLPATRSFIRRWRSGEFNHPENADGR